MRQLLSALLLLGALPAGAQEPAAESVAPTTAEPSVPRRAEPDFATMDRLELDATVVTGNRELPKVMYVVPWKRADLGELGGKPLNSLVDEVLAPVDRDVFERENGYYRALDVAAEPEVETPVTAADGAP